MKFQKWHFGVISIILIVFAVIVVWQIGINKNNSNKQGQGKVAGVFSGDENISTNIDLTKPLFFFSETCSHCQKMKPIVTDLQSQGYQIEWVDASSSQNEELDNKYQITGVPTFVRPDGQKLIGEQDQQTLAIFLKDYKNK